MTTDRKAEGATGGRWRMSWGRNDGTSDQLLREGGRPATVCIELTKGISLIELRDLLNRGELADSLRADLDALRVAYEQLAPVAKANRDEDYSILSARQWELEKAIRAVLPVLASSAAEPTKPSIPVCPNCGATMVLHFWERPGGAPGNGFRCPACQSTDAPEPSPGADPGTFMVHSDAEPPIDAPEPGKAEAKAACRWRPEDEEENRAGPDCGEPAEFISCMPYRNTPTCAAHKCRCAKPIAPSPPEPQGAQGADIDAIRKRYGKATLSFIVGSGGVPSFADIEASIRDVPALIDIVAALETKLAEAEREEKELKVSVRSCQDYLSKIDVILDPGPDYPEEETIDGARRVVRERDEARAKLARYEAWHTKLSGIAERWHQAREGSSAEYEAGYELVRELHTGPTDNSTAAPEPPKPAAAGKEEP